MPELLSPAGSFESLKAAVENGADAVYIGGRSFSARQNAENFDECGMCGAIEYAHVRGVNVYVAMNTLIADAEMQQAVDEAGRTYEAGADALIVQDLGFASVLGKHISGLPLHLSTQGTVYSAGGVRALAPFGFTRVILARELTLDEITVAVKESPVPVEVFAHGALCVCYSGQCLMSSLIGARSGNRGTCAQPCRLPYRLSSAKGYLLSPRDLCSLELLPELVASGVAALKIEGRMKSPEYVAVVTSIYRKYLDLCGEGGPYAVDGEDMQDLLQVFNRGGFTAGYLLGRQGRDMISRERPKHWGLPVGKVLSHHKAAGVIEAQLTGTVSLGDGVEIANDAAPGNIVTYLMQGGEQARTANPGCAGLGTIRGPVKPGDLIYKTSSKALNERAAASYTGKPRKKIAISGKFTARAGQPLQFVVGDGDGRLVSAEGGPAAEALTIPLREEAVLSQLAKTGDTPFMLEQCAVELDGRAAAKLSELNALRREALTKLEAVRSSRYPGRAAYAAPVEPAGVKASPVQPRLSLFFWRWSDEYGGVLHLADRVYLPFGALAQGKVRFPQKPPEWMPWLPAVTNGAYNEWVRGSSGGLRALGASGVLIGNMEHLDLLEGRGLPLYGGASLNAFNGWTLDAYARLGLAGITLSHELTIEQAAALPDAGIEKEAAVYGRLGLMTSAHCPVGAELAGQTGGKPCGLCEKGAAFELVDRTGAKFPVVCDPAGCRSVILNGDVLAVPGLARRLGLAGVAVLRLTVYDEAPEQVESVIRQFRQALSGGEAEGLAGRGYTKGHYFRGV